MALIAQPRHTTAADEFFEPVGRGGVAHLERLFNILIGDQRALLFDEIHYLLKTRFILRAFPGARNREIGVQLVLKYSVFVRIRERLLCLFYNFFYRLFRHWL